MRAWFVTAMLAAVLAVSGCQTTRVSVVYKNKLIEVPADLLRCPGVEYPDPDSLTDKQVARLIASLARANGNCRSNMEAIKKFVARVKTELEEKEKKD